MATCRKYPEEEVQEELVALRSILGEEKFHAGGSGERGTMLVALEKAGGGPFLVRNAVSGSTVEVATLGDLEVRFKMREDYPEREMPEFSLDCFWMTSEQLGRLAELLKSEWTEGEVVLYHWYQLLRDRALETLEIEDRLTVESGQVLRELVRLDAKAKGTRFSECLICFSELSCQDFEVAGEKGCNHFYCRRCLAVYCRTQIEDEGNQAGVKCPDPACDSVLDHGVVRRLVGTRLFEHYDRGMLHRAIRSMSSTTWCPRVDCQHPAQVREAERCGQCPACGFVFCTQCERTFHGPTRCDSHQLHLLEAAREEDGAGGEAAPSKDLDELEGMLRSVGLAKAKEHVDRVVGEMLSSLTHGERERLATQYLEGGEEERAELEERYGKAYISYHAYGGQSMRSFQMFMDILRGEETKVSLDAIKYCKVRGVKECPRCFVQIEKNGGCHHMHCTYCGHHFCWDCANPIGDCVCY